MSPKSLSAILAVALLGWSAPAVQAQEAAPAAPVTVTVNGEAVMPSLRGIKQPDTFTLTLEDRQVATRFTLVCNAATNWLAGLVRSNRRCTLSGSGVIINPQDPTQRAPRTQYAGGFEVAADGTSDLSQVVVTYLPAGTVGGSSATLSGTLRLKPEHPSEEAEQLKIAILKRLNLPAGAAGTLADTRVDTVETAGLFIPSAGLPSDHGCTWQGSMAFAYQSRVWFMDLTAVCDGVTTALKGSMPWLAVPEVKDRTQYNLALTVPGAASAGDEALFARPAGAGSALDLPDGIDGTLVMDEGMYTMVDVDGKSERLPMRTKISGTLSGRGVPLATVRSLGQLMVLLARTFFGA